EEHAIRGLWRPASWRPLECQASPPRISEWLAWSDLTIIAAGITLWECLCTEAPAVSYYRNEYQRGVLLQLERLGCVRVLGGVDGSTTEAARSALEDVLSSAPRRRAMAATGRELIDGRGAERVVQALRAG